ncbi:MAG TPA: aromatic-ring-hydroxylating dioxygenase subunit beta [Dehalococcoidia bacterium]|nr:aromatic-ring-hydroxylating dioxygenase subunit beta [Dehalococcoidia bacterium]
MAFSWFKKNGTGARPSLREQVEEFLAEEAWLLDEWRLDDWFQLFTEDGSYVVPGTGDPQADPRSALVLIDDDMVRLHWRIERLKSRHAYREYPWSRTRRIISNIRARDMGDHVFVTASVVLYRFRHGHADPFVGHYEYRLVRDNGSFKIQQRRAMMDHERLTPNGAVSMIF